MFLHYYSFLLIDNIVGLRVISLQTGVRGFNHHDSVKYEVKKLTSLNDFGLL